MRIPTMKKVIEAMCSTEEEAKLFRAVMRQGPDWKDIYTYPEDYRDASAGVSGFIYYSETIPFAKHNLVEIIHTLNEFEQELGEPLKKDQDNLLNWYAWFALEHIVQLVMDYKEANSE